MIIVDTKTLLHLYNSGRLNDLKHHLVDKLALSEYESKLFFKKIDSERNVTTKTINKILNEIEKE